MKTSFEAAVPGLNFEDFDVKWGTSEVGLQAKGQLNDAETEDKLFAWDEAEMKIDPYPLGFKKLDVKEANLGGVYLSSKLFTKLGEAAIEQAGGNTASGNQDGGLPDFNFNDLDHKDILERFTGSRELLSEQKLKKLEEDAKNIRDKWSGIDKTTKKQAEEIQNKIDDFKSKYAKGGLKTDYKAEIDSIKAKAESLKGKKFDASNLAEIPKLIEDARALKLQAEGLKAKIKKTKDDLKSDIDFVKNTKNEVKGLTTKFKDAKKDLEIIKQDVKEVREAGKEDFAMLKKELDPRNYDAAKITRLLFGKEWEEKFLYYQSLWFKVREYLPEDSEEEMAAEAAGEKEKEEQKSIIDAEKPIEFKRDPEFPDWLVRTFRIAGRTPQEDSGEEIDFQGKILDMTSHENVHGKPVSWDIDAMGGKVKLLGVYSRIHNIVDKRNLLVNYKGQSMVGKKWGSKQTRVIFEQGELSTDVKFDLTGGDEIVGRGKLNIKNAVFKIGQEVKPVLRDPLRQAVDRLLSEPLPYEVTLRYKKMPKIKFGGSFNDVFKDALKSALNNLAQEKTAALSKDFQAKLEQKIAGKASSGEMQKVLSAFTNNAGGLSNKLTSSLLGIEQTNSSNQAKLGSGENALNGVVGQLLGLENSSQSVQTQIKNEIKKRAEDEAKKRLEEELRKRLLKDQAKKAKEDELRRQLEERKRKEAEKLKNKLKDKIKLPF